MPYAPETAEKRSFFTDVQSYQIVDGQVPFAELQGDLAIVEEVLHSGLPEIRSPHKADPSDRTAAIAIPVYCHEQLVNVLVMKIENVDAATGVFEVWSPVGEYHELALRQGFYGRLERFQNVSSFVRFEQGSGLPGQAWQQHRAILHDALANHPGFLRAAGASADALQTAIGLPVFASDFLATVVLISSVDSPMARGYEVWSADGDEFVLDSCVYDGSPDLEPLDKGQRLDRDAGLLGRVVGLGGAVVSRNIVAIPQFDDHQVSSVTVLHL